MTAAEAEIASSLPDRRRGTWVYQLIVLYLVALRLVFDFTVNPMGDEAYYWIWGQHPQLSYFDHPPLHAWLMGLVSQILGWSPFSLRALTWLTLGGSLWILWLIVGRLFPQDRLHHFWKAATIYLSLPLIVIATTPAFHDHLLAFLCLAAIYCLLSFAADHEAGQSNLRWFYLAAAFTGLAALTRYNGVLLAVGFAVFLAVRPSMRGLWRSPHPYLAALIVAALQLPVLIWNFDSGFATLALHFHDRPTGHWSEPNAVGILQFIVGMLLTMGPFFLVGFGLIFTTKPTSAFESIQRSLVLCLFLTSSLCVAAVSVFSEVFLHWNIVAYIAAATLGVLALRRHWLLWPQIALALYLATAATWNYSVAPLRVPLFEDPGTAPNYGWPEVATTVRAAQAQHPDAFLAATRYTYAAQLAFELRDPAVTAFNALPSQYDLWWDAAAHRGQDAIIVADRRFGIDFAAKQFGSVTPIAQVPVYRPGSRVWQFELYLAEGYAEPAAR